MPTLASAPPARNRSLALFFLSFQSSTAPPRKEPRVELAACSRKEFFDEFADNLEARSDRYTHQSGPGIIALF